MRNLSAVVLAMFLLTLTAIAVHKLTDEVKTLNNQITALKQRTKALKKENAELRASTAELNTQKRASEGIIKRQEQLIKQFEQEIKALKRRLNNIKMLDVTATYYTPHCAGCNGITKTGIDVRDSVYTAQGYRIIAVDPALIPLGTVVTVKTPYNTFKAVVADTGGAIKGRRIDILVSTKGEAIRKGKVRAKVVWQN